MTIHELALKVFNNLSNEEVLDYTCTAINSLLSTQMYDSDFEFNLAFNSSRRLVKDFIINTLIVNEIHNGFRDEETGELIDNISSIQYGIIK